MGKTQAHGDTQNNRVSNGAGETVEVLYQKMGDRWFAFSLIGDDVFVGSLTQDELEGTPAKDFLTGKNIGNS
jgi:hypothetical protein